LKRLQLIQILWIKNWNPAVPQLPGEKRADVNRASAARATRHARTRASLRANGSAKAALQGILRFT
jgi:hypothetical protein